MSKSKSTGGKKKKKTLISDHPGQGGRILKMPVGPVHGVQTRPHRTGYSFPAFFQHLQQTDVFVLPAHFDQYAFAYFALVSV